MLIHLTSVEKHSKFIVVFGGQETYKGYLYIPVQDDFDKTH